ncbi:alpha/beta fold hydrolase [Vulcanococcus limneticus]|uniref:alpha/beta fold hydrolase n=1 Tax=Vulcanococcus limneticus TaxID=2170428 RepID=UPI00398BBC9F
MFEVWTRRSGASAGIKLVLLHGGPGCSHETFEVFDRCLPEAGIELYFYDHLGSHPSSQPDHEDLSEINRFGQEVEQVRQALGLDASNVVLLGHSRGGILAVEYALQHQQQLKGLLIPHPMDPLVMAAMAEALPKGRHLHGPEGRPMALVDDPAVVMRGLIDFLHPVDRGTLAAPTAR